MAWTERKTRVTAGVIVLLAILLVILICGSSERGRLKLPVGKGAPAISLGERHGLILASDGSLWCWGSDFFGWPVLGLGSASGPFGTRTTSLRRIGSETNWVGISAGMSHSLAIKSDGTLWTWGESVQPQRSGLLKPIPTPAPAAPGNDWVKAAAGGVHSLAIKRDGTLWAWGNNWAGSVGIDSINGSSIPVKVGVATNWVKVWADVLESVGLQSDGSLWYWGDSLNQALKQDVGKITVPTRVSPDTNWVDVGFAVNTVLAIKSDGTLWAWGRNAEVYTGATNPVQNLTPARVGINSDWRAISACAGWWCQGLIKKDGSLWFMDASDGQPNGPRPPYKPVQFKRIAFQKDYAAYAAGGVHAAAAGVHGPVGVVLTRDGEVWTWGLVLGDPLTLRGHSLNAAVGLAQSIHLKVRPYDPPPVFRKEPWQLRNIEPEAAR